MKTTLKGKWALDTNLLVYALDQDSPFYSGAKQVFNQILKGQFQPVVSTQNVTEAIRVLTKAYDKSLSVVVETIDTLLTSFEMEIVSPFPTTVQTFYRLSSLATKNKTIYDIFLAATLIDNQITQLLTNNDKDFKYFKDLKVVNPFK